MRRLQALLRILGQAAPHHPLQGGRGQRLQSGERWGLGSKDGRDEACLALPLERLAARRHFVEHGAEGEQIAARVGRLPLQLLRRHVLHRPDDCPFGGQRTSVRRCGRNPGDPRRRLRVRPRQTEIEKFRAGPRQHDVAGLEIAVDDSPPVRRIESAGDLDRVVHRLTRWQGSLRQTIGERLPFQELHHKVINAVLVADVVQRADIRMGEARDRACLTLQPLPPPGVPKDGLEQDFDRDDPIEPRVPGAIHLSHPAGTCRRQDLVRPEPGAWGESHAWAGIIDPPGGGDVSRPAVHAGSEVTISVCR